MMTIELTEVVVQHNQLFAALCGLYLCKISVYSCKDTFPIEQRFRNITKAVKGYSRPNFIKCTKNLGIYKVIICA